SGIQPSGALHLGNYFGMMVPAIKLQERGEAFYFIADYHALTTLHDAPLLRKNVRDVAIDFLAAGLDPKKSCFFRQSDIAGIAELSWILTTVAPMGLLERCHSYKDKIAKGLAASVGLFSYPILMAADILIYESDLVPVGKDQKQHVEVARDLAVKMNETYGPLFKLPEPKIQEGSALVPGIDGAKMSKSYGNTIELFLEETAMRKKVMSIKTDSTPVDDSKSIEDSIILELYGHVASPADYTAMKNAFLSGGSGYGFFKKQLFEAIWEYLAPLRARREELLRDPGYVEAVLKEGAIKANAIADHLLQRVRKAVGLQ
ncbi:MAG: tryptophan--tRNA ligase, partial [Chthoniobacterales bacterium]|nr:tryptophan--tRNA ligase [Chthoniobacterales bacterium]